MTTPTAPIPPSPANAPDVNTPQCAEHDKQDAPNLPNMQDIEDTQKPSSVWRLNTADRWSVKWALLAAIPVSILVGAQTTVVAAQTLTGEPVEPIWQTLGLAPWTAATVYCLLVATTITALAMVVRGWLARMDETERYVEFRACTYSLIAIVSGVFAIAPATYWFDSVHAIFSDWWWAILYATYVLSYFIARATIRRQMNA